nr:hypothetical protein [Tanacetum cinerariifolium]
VAPRMMNPVNARNPTTGRGACFECGGTDHFKVDVLGRNKHKDPEEVVQTKLWPLTGVKVVETTISRHMEAP